MEVKASMPVHHSVAEVSVHVLAVCTLPMSTRTQSSTVRRHNERFITWNNIVRNLASRNAGRIFLMSLEHDLRALDHARFTTDGIHFDSIEGQRWMNRVFQEQLVELAVELFDTGVLRTRDFDTDKLPVSV